MQDLGTQGLNHDQSGDDIDDLDIGWDEVHVWTRVTDIEGFSEWQGERKKIKSGNVESSPRTVPGARTLNEKQK